MLEAAVSCPMRTELWCDRNHPCKSAFKSGRNIHFMENKVYSAELKKTCVSTGTKPSMLEAEGSFPLFCYEN
jgi:hypothetical protein